MKERIKYLDVAKFIGIFCIYLGHFSEVAGKGYAFVFSFHVPLFFFISGCSECLTSQKPFLKYAINNIKTLIIPSFFFVVISTVLQCISLDTHTQIGPNIISILNGCIRNRVVVGGVWFLTCLFVVRIMFYAIRRLVKRKILVLIPCAILFVVAETMIVPHPLENPHMMYNLDSACYYIIFYGLGYVCFDLVKKLLQWDRLYKQIVSFAVGGLCLVYAVALFFGINLLGAFYTMPIASSLCSIIVPMIMIFLIFVVSKLLEDVQVLSQIGENTLFLCGSEYAVKLLATSGLQIFGLSTSFANPLVTYLYVFSLLYICNKTLVPWERSIFKKFRIL